jgi:hypothetical protein
VANICLKVLWVVVMLWGGGASAQAPATPTPGASAPLLPFVGSDALGVSTLKRSNIEALWGPPEKVSQALHSEKVMNLSRRRSAHRDVPTLRLHYPSVGLIFDTAPGFIDEVDPPLAYATVSSPHGGCTPQGLCIGMAEDTALPIITQHYKRMGDIAASWGKGGYVKGRIYLARNHGWRTTHQVSFTFKQGRLHEMSIQLQPHPWVTPTRLRAALNVVLLMGLLALVALALKEIKRTLGPVWEKGRLVLGGLLLLAGVAGMVLGFGALLGSGDGYAKLSAFVFALGAAGLLVFGLLLFSGSSNTTVSRPAKATLIAGVVLLLLTKLF